MLAQFALPLLLLAAAPALGAESVEPPPGAELLFKFAARGDQIYACASNANGYEWRFSGPQAELFDASGAKVGKHYAGPTWEANDGSRVRGHVVTSKNAADGASVPWLLLSAAAHEGEGRMAEVAYIRRVDTKGGVAPKEPCTANRVGEVSKTPYEANYLFYRAAN